MKFPSKDKFFEFGLWDLLCLICGTFGQVAYIADLLKPHFHTYFVVLLFTVPVCLLVCIQPGDSSNKLITRCHLFAALWYTTITFVTEILSLIGYVPIGSTFYRILMHLGWIYCFRIIRNSYLINSNKNI